MIWGRSPGLAASGLVWAGLRPASGRRCSSFWILGRGGWRVPNCQRSDLARGCGARGALLQEAVEVRAAQAGATGQSPTTGFKHELASGL